jgi:hypothetical protein
VKLFFQGRLFALSYWRDHSIKAAAGRGFTLESLLGQTKFSFFATAANGRSPPILWKNARSRAQK